MPDNYNTVNGHISKSKLSAEESHNYYSFQQLHSCADELKKYNDDIHARDRTNASILETEIRERNNTEAVSIMASVESTKHNQGKMFELTQRIVVLSNCLQDELIPGTHPEAQSQLSNSVAGPSKTARPAVTKSSDVSTPSSSKGADSKSQGTGTSEQEGGTKASNARQAWVRRRR